jgi:adenylate cyclase
MGRVLKFIVIIALLLFQTALTAQSKKELKEQNDELKKRFNELSVEKANIERQKTLLELDKRRLETDRLELARKTKELDEAVKKQQKELKLSVKEIETSKNVIKEKTNEIIEKNANISSLEEEMKISELIAKQNELELKNKRASQKILILGISLIALISVLLLFMFINRKKASKILELEKKKSDQLLLNILPQEIADELKNTQKTQARSYELSTVLFADIKGFTGISATLKPSVLIQELDYIFGAFDDIIQKHNIEKIKVIGDCFMCVGGIPNANTTNPEDVVYAAIEMQEFMHRMKEERIKTKGQVYEVRIGINTGPIVAGVIGSKKFAYDVWGNTVNLASRLEAACEAGKINISAHTYERVKDKFACVYRGKIDVKGKTGLDMYFVTNAVVTKQIIENIPSAS